MEDINWKNIPEPLIDSINYLSSSINSTRQSLETLLERSEEKLHSAIELLKNHISEIQKQLLGEAVVAKYFDKVDKLRYSFKNFIQESKSYKDKSTREIDSVNYNFQRSIETFKSMMDRKILTQEKNNNEKLNNKFSEVKKNLFNIDEKINQVDDQFKEIHEKHKKAKEKMYENLSDMEYQSSRRTDALKLSLDNLLSKHDILTNKSTKLDEKLDKSFENIHSISEDLKSAIKNIQKCETSIQNSEQQIEINKNNINRLFHSLKNLESARADDKADHIQKINLVHILIDEYKAHMAYLVPNEIKRALENFQFKKLEIEGDDSVEARLYNLEVRLRATETQKMIDMKALVEKIRPERRETPKHKGLNQKIEIKDSNLSRNVSPLEIPIKTVRSVSRGLGRTKNTGDKKPLPLTNAMSSTMIIQQKNLQK